MSATASRIPDTVRFWLHADGAATLVAALVLYDRLGGPMSAPTGCWATG